MMTNIQFTCLAALARGSLRRVGQVWLYGKRERVFGNATVKALIDHGLAKRIGDSVVSVIGLNDNGQGR